MKKQLKLKALNWAHKIVAGLQKRLEHELKELEPFSEQDMRDELYNRYPDFCG